MKYYAGPAAKRIAEQISVASERGDGHGLDLSDLDVPDAQALFQKGHALRENGGCNACSSPLLTRI